MNTQRIEELKILVDELAERGGEKTAAKLELDKCKRIFERLASFAPECVECGHYLDELENHMVQLKDKVDHLTKDEIKQHRLMVVKISSHLQKQHKLVESGYYMSIYMSLGLSLGVVFGLLLFDNIGLGLAMGIGVGLAIGVGKDEDAKKKGLTI